MRQKGSLKPKKYNMKQNKRNEGKKALQEVIPRGFFYDSALGLRPKRFCTAI